jgi:glutamyl-tRNA reductase
MLINRTLHKAEHLAQRYGGEPYPFTAIEQTLTLADIAFTATSATAPVLTVERMRAIMQQRDHQPLTLIDLAVPRNIDHAVAALPGIQLYDVDDLRAAVDDALAARRTEIPHVEEIIATLLEEWRQQSRELRLRPVVVGLRQQAEQTRHRVVERTLQHLERQQGAVDEATAAQLVYLSRALVNQLLHEPTVKLKQTAAEPDGATYAALVCDLFGLDIPIPTDDNETQIGDFDLTWVTAKDEMDDDPTHVSADDDAFVTPQCTPQCTPLCQALRYELVGQP